MVGMQTQLLEKQQTEINMIKKNQEHKWDQMINMIKNIQEMQREKKPELQQTPGTQNINMEVLLEEIQNQSKLMFEQQQQQFQKQQDKYQQQLMEHSIQILNKNITVLANNQESGLNTSEKKKRKSLLIDVEQIEEEHSKISNTPNEKSGDHQPQEKQHNDLQISTKQYLRSLSPRNKFSPQHDMVHRQDLFRNSPFQHYYQQKMEQLIQNNPMETLITLRENALQKRHQTELEIIDHMYQSNRVSPKTYHNKKIEIEKWVENEKKELMQTKTEIEKGWKFVEETFQRTQRDIQLLNRIRKSKEKKSQSKEGNSSINNNILSNGFKDISDNLSYEQITIAKQLHFETQSSCFKSNQKVISPPRSAEPLLVPNNSNQLNNSSLYEDPMYSPNIKSQVSSTGKLVNTNSSKMSAKQHVVSEVLAGSLENVLQSSQSKEQHMESIVEEVLEYLLNDMKEDMLIHKKEDAPSNSKSPKLRQEVAPQNTLLPPQPGINNLLEQKQQQKLAQSHNLITAPYPLETIKSTYENCREYITQVHSHITTHLPTVFITEINKSLGMDEAVKLKFLQNQILADLLETDGNLSASNRLEQDMLEPNQESICPE